MPPEGQTFTTLAELQSRGYKNVWWNDKKNHRIWSVRTEPKVTSSVRIARWSFRETDRTQFAIGERAMLIQTAAGNILWDLIPFLDQETVDKVNALGGLRAIVISHPHYYSTYADWSRSFSCPVYIGAPDKEWLEPTATPDLHLRFLTDTYTSILAGSGAIATLAGGHFPGSLLLHWERNLFIADTIFTAPSAMNPIPGKEGVISFTFFWSIPNRIPLHPDDVLMIWRKVKDFEFDSAFGAFEGMDVRTMENEAARGTGGVKGRLLQSCKIYVKAMGWKEHEIFSERL